MKSKMLVFSVFIFFACEPLREERRKTAFAITLPANFKVPMIQPEYNMATEKGVALGRMLFYDPILSGNNKISCASCHQQNRAFADQNKRFSFGISGKDLLRHSPTLFNLAWSSGLFWDGGAKNLESQVFAPLNHKDEMDKDLKLLVHELKNHHKYHQKFKEAFGTDSISSSQIAWALAQFERTLISSNSKYDKWVRKENGVKLSSIELQGFEIYKNACASCHIPDLFTDNDYHNNGLDSVFIDASHENLYKGRFRISDKPSDIGKFKTPSLRNILLTSPYMHDGRFKTLAEVIDHYSENITQSSTLGNTLITKEKSGFHFSAEEKKALLVFLETLTDYEFISDPKFSNPEVQ